MDQQQACSKNDDRVVDQDIGDLLVEGSRR